MGIDLAIIILGAGILGLRAYKFYSNEEYRDEIKTKVAKARTYFSKKHAEHRAKTKEPPKAARAEMSNPKAEPR